MDNTRFVFKNKETRVNTIDFENERHAKKGNCLKLRVYLNTFQKKCTRRIEKVIKIACTSRRKKL